MHLSRIYRGASTTLRKRLRMTVLAGLLIWGGPATAHEQWLDTDDFYPSVGDTVTVHICSGHYFPSSSSAVAAKVLASLSATDPVGDVIPLTTEESGKTRSTSLSIDKKGTYVIRAVLKRPMAPEPSAELRLLLVAGGGTDRADLYRDDSGMELVPHSPVTAAHPGDKLSLSIHKDGAVTAGSITVLAERGGTGSYSTTEERPANIRIRKPGRHLCSTSRGARTCALTFEIKESE